MRRPKYGWEDLVFRTSAALLLALATADTLFGLRLWGTAFCGVALGLIACSKVDRLRQDLRADRPAALRGDQP